jgi:predicted small lipoprotein YifL
MQKRLSLCAAIALTLAGLLGIPGCGVRGSLEAPPEAKTETGQATPGTPGKPGEGPAKPSVLDPLIR